MPGVRNASPLSGGGIFMSITRFAFASLVACAVGAVPLARATAAATLANDDIKLSGCLVKGEGDGASYLLTNAPAEPAWQQSADAKVTPGAVGTTGTYATIFYWLSGD